MAANASALRVTSRNAAFQQWQALLTNRVKRQRAREFIVQGVRPITLAVERGSPIDAMIYDMSRPLSRWAQDMLAATGAQRVAMAPELLQESGEKDDGVPEMVAVGAMPPDDFSRITHSEADIADTDLTGPAVIVIGNETSGLSAAWRQACDVVARIPITGVASSLNAAGAATVVLYEAARQRRGAALRTCQDG